MREHLLVKEFEDFAVRTSRPPHSQLPCQKLIVSASEEELIRYSLRVDRGRHRDRSCTLLFIIEEIDLGVEGTAQVKPDSVLLESGREQSTEGTEGSPRAGSMRAANV